jgi:hypothetical protein
MRLQLEVLPVTTDEHSERRTRELEDIVRVLEKSVASVIATLATVRTSHPILRWTFR